MRRRGCISGNKKEGFYPPRGKVDLGSGGTTPPIPRVLPRENSPAPMSPEKHKEKASAFADAFVIACSFHTRSLNLGKRIYINLPRVRRDRAADFSPVQKMCAAESGCRITFWRYGTRSAGYAKRRAFQIASAFVFLLHNPSDPPLSVPGT